MNSKKICGAFLAVLGVLALAGCRPQAHDWIKFTADIERQGKVAVKVSYEGPEKEFREEVRPLIEGALGEPPAAKKDAIQPAPEKK